MEFTCESPLPGRGIWAFVGYARVSTNGQDYNGQISELKAAGCGRIYREKVSGAKSDRAELGKLLKALTDGDVVIVSRLDRLARSTLDLLNILRRVTEAGAKFRSLKDRPDATHGSLHGRIAAGVTPLTQLPPEPHRCEPREGCQPLAQIRQEAIGAPLRHWSRAVGRRLEATSDISADGLSIDAKLTGNGRHRQALPM
jgi:hypothetical protein